MADFDISIKVRGLREAVLDTREMADRSVDMSPAFDGPIDESVRRMFFLQFQTEGRFGGKEWRKLSPMTLALKARRGRANMGILRLSNRLWSSLVKRRSVGTILVVRRNLYRRGTSIPYAAKHEDPEAFGLKRLPRRHIIPPVVPVRWERRWRDILAAYVTEGEFLDGLKN